MQTRLSTGREEALDRLWRELGDRLWRAVVAYSGDPDIASDAVAEAFAQCLRRGDELRSPAGWIWKVAFRVAAGELKRRRRWHPRSEETSYEMAESSGELVRALAELSPKQRAALVLHYYGGYSTSEAASILRSTAATVRVHLSQGRKRLRRLLEERDG